MEPPTHVTHPGGVTGNVAGRWSHRTIDQLIAKQSMEIDISTKNPAKGPPPFTPPGGFSQVYCRGWSHMSINPLIDTPPTKDRYYNTKPFYGAT